MWRLDDVRAPRATRVDTAGEAQLVPIHPGQCRAALSRFGVAGAGGALSISERDRRCYFCTAVTEDQFVQSIEARFFNFAGGRDPATIATNEPASIPFVLPTQDDARNFVVDQVEPLFAASPVLRNTLIGGAG